MIRAPAPRRPSRPGPARADARLDRLVRALRAYLRLREGAGPESPATRLAARALRRACDEALADRRA